MGTEDLESLLARAKDVPMSEEEKEAQRRDFAYGNTRLSNPAITRELVDEVADRMPRGFLQSQMDQPKPHLVQRLLRREEPHPEADSIFRLFEADWMGAAEFEHGILGEALVQACQRCEPERWFVRSIVAGPEIVVYYVGPEIRFESAVKFLQTQLIVDGSERYMAERPLKEATCLRQAYLSQDSRSQRIVGWWRLDLDYQFFFFKSSKDANLCLSTLQTTDWKAFVD